jgi:two-component system phosphate regulon sensor histidine kinase PhoR
VAADHFGLDPQRDRLQRITNLVRAPAFVAHLQAGLPAEPLVIRQRPAAAPLSVLVRAYGDGQKLVLTQDITERERADADAPRLRGQRVARDPHAADGAGGLRRDDGQLPLTEAERQRVLGLMAQQTERMQALVADLLTLAQLEGSPRPPPTSGMRWPRCCAGAQADGRRCRQGGTRSSSSRPRPNWPATGRTAQRRGQPGQQRRALHARGGRIDVRLARARRRRREIEVSDTGPASPRTPEPAPDRALLPRRRQPLARDRRHRAGPGHRQARGAAPWRRDGDRQRTRQAARASAALPACAAGRLRPARRRPRVRATPRPMELSATPSRR